ncbi:hypothetical protein [Streptomyces sp. NPDC050848]|uniref:hypothetical protein n=1 Tax=Streptomyces sp. NPDC050848 TaxID=3155791 RepID=UPI0033F02F2B
MPVIFDLPKLVFEAALKLMRLQGLTPKQAVAKAKQQFPGASTLNTKELERKLEAEAAKDAAQNAAANKTGTAAKTAATAPLAAGRYVIRRSAEEYLTLHKRRPDGRYPGGGVRPRGQALAGDSYLGYDEVPDVDVLTGAFPEPVHWARAPAPTLAGSPSPSPAPTST